MEGVLRAVGVAEGDERVYRALLGDPAAGVVELGRLCGCPVAQVEAALSRLVGLGLVRWSGGGYEPVNPQAAIGALVWRRHAQVEAVRVVCDVLVEQFRTGHLQSHPGHLIDVVTGPEAVAGRSAELLAGVVREVLVMDQPPYAAPVGGEAASEVPVLRRGVRMRVIYSRPALTMPGRFPVISQLIEAGQGARTLPRLPIKLRIYDQYATVPLTVDEYATQSVAVIHPSGLSDALVGLFEMYWTRAHPLAAASLSQADVPGRALSEDQLRIVGMLDAGFSDEAIAGELEVSVRTLRRRIRVILDALEVTTRFQAGRQAHLHGWLTHHQREGPTAEIPGSAGQRQE